MRFPWLDLKPKYLEQINTSQESEVNYWNTWKRRSPQSGKMQYTICMYGMWPSRISPSFSPSLALFPSFLLCPGYRQTSEPRRAKASSSSGLFFHQANAPDGPGSYSKLRNMAIGGWLSFCLCFLISGFALLKGIFIGGPVFQQHAALIWGGH